MNKITLNSYHILLAIAISTLSLFFLFKSLGMFELKVISPPITEALCNQQEQWDKVAFSNRLTNILEQIEECYPIN